MLKIFTALTLLAVGHAANAQQSETRTVSGFIKIDVTDGVKVRYTQGDDTTLTVESEDNKGISGLRTEIIGETLKISNKDAGKLVTVKITSPEIVFVKVSKNADFTLMKPLRASQFSAVLDSGSTFFGIVKSGSVTHLSAFDHSIYNIRVETGSLIGTFQSGAKVNLSGISDSFFIHAKDDAFCNAKNFVTEKMEVNAEDYATVLVYVKKRKYAFDVGGDAKITYVEAVAK